MYYKRTKTLRALGYNGTWGLPGGTHQVSWFGGLSRDGSRGASCFGCKAFQVIRDSTACLTGSICLGSGLTDLRMVLGVCVCACVELKVKLRHCIRDDIISQKR